MMWFRLMVLAALVALLAGVLPPAGSFLLAVVLVWFAVRWVRLVEAGDR